MWLDPDKEKNQRNKKKTNETRKKILDETSPSSSLQCSSVWISPVVPDQNVLREFLRSTRFRLFAGTNPPKFHPEVCVKVFLTPWRGFLGVLDCYYQWIGVAVRYSCNFLCIFPSIFDCCSLIRKPRRDEKTRKQFVHFFWSDSENRWLVAAFVTHQWIMAWRVCCRSMVEQNIPIFLFKIANVNSSSQRSHIIYIHINNNDSRRLSKSQWRQIISFCLCR